MANRCSVYRLSHRQDVDRALRSGAGEKYTAERFGLSKSTIHRHRADCLHLGNGNGSGPNYRQLELVEEVLLTPGLQERVDARIAASAMSTKEVVGTVVSHMRADMTDFFDMRTAPEVIRIAAKKGLGHLIKKLKVRRQIGGRGAKTSLYLQTCFRSGG